jgi:hypothetical protein
MGDPYAQKERAFAEPFVEELVANAAFRRWLIARIGLSELAIDARLLHEEMKARRTKAATSWWASHFNGRCKCEGCRGGRETDLLAIFELRDESRIALHIEVKQPTDRFPADKDQAENYQLRAACWLANCPERVLPHSRAHTVLLCSEKRLADFALHLAKFGSVLTFEEVALQFPQVKFPFN